MSYRILATDALAAPVSPAGGVVLTLPAVCGDCRVHRIQAAPGLDLVHSDYRPAHDLIETSQREDARPMLVVTIALDGESDYRDAADRQLNFVAGQTTAVAAKAGRGERRYRAGARVQQLRVVVDEALLLHYAGLQQTRQWLGNEGTRQLGGFATPPAVVMQARAAAQQLRGGNAAPLAVHRQALALLEAQLHHLSPRPRPAAPSSRVTQQLDAARTWMETRLAERLTLAQLAAVAQMGTSQFTRTFRQRFGSSPMQLLLQLRMQRAQALLDAGAQVAQAGWDVGYAHPANFSTAYARFFGRPPRRPVRQAIDE